METREVPVEVASEPKPRNRPRWRFQLLLALTAVVVALFLISRLEPDQAKSYGPFIESVYRAFNPPVEFELSDEGRQFIAEIATLGGRAGRIEPERRMLGLLGVHETFVVSFSEAKFDDAALLWLAAKHGDRVGALHLLGTSVTDDGLRHLKRFRYLHSLSLAILAPLWVNGKRLEPITDLGMAQLDLPSLATLNLGGLPITDAGLNSLPDLSSLHGLLLTGTKVEGPGLSRLVKFRNLSSLHLNGAAVTDEGLRHLAGASNLVVLTLDGMPLSGAGLKYVLKLPHLAYLSIRGCQVPADDIAELKAKAPSLRIER